MGQYLNLLTSVKNYIYNGRIDAARDTMKRLLNGLNMDYTSESNPSEKARYKQAILKLLPVLDELKVGKVSEVTIRALSLDRNRLSFGAEQPWQSAPSYPSAQPHAIPPRPEAPVIPPRPSVPLRPEAPVIPPRPSVPLKPEAPVIPQRPSMPESSSAAPKRPSAPEISGEKKPATGGKIMSKSKNPMMPLTFDDYIGQEKAKRSLAISIGAAKKTGRPLAHLLICSPYGLGKTTLVNIIANEMGLPFLNVNATNLKDVKALSLYFSKLDKTCIVFIDEIHTLKKEVQTVLLSIMTDFSVSLIDEAGDEQVFEIPAFTLVGATTQAGELLKPFLNRFAIIELENYTEDEKLLLIKNKFEKLGYAATEDAIAEISRRCRGVPRTIETYVKGVIDVALTRDETLITKEITDLFFEIREIDSLGLTKNDLYILRVLDEAKKPLALITIESKSGIQKEDIEYRYEPYLIKMGFIEKTERGRIITKKGHLYLHPEEAGDDTAEDAKAPEEEISEEPADKTLEPAESDGEISDEPADKTPEPAEPDGETSDEPAEEASADAPSDLQGNGSGEEGAGGGFDDFFSKINEGK